MSYRAFAEIDLGAIAHNVALIKSQTSAEILAVVKADAYGHGLLPIAQTAVNSGASWLGVALLEEALLLRKGGIDVRTIAWLTPPGDDFVSALEHNIDLSISSIALLDEVLQAGKKVGVKPRIHIEIDTGMRRGGVLDEWDALLEHLVRHKDECTVVGLWTHFARADEPESGFTNEQIQVFDARLQQLSDAGITPEIIHLSNSAATLAHPHAHRNVVRLGIAMYGLSPDVSNMGNNFGLKSAMTLKAKLALVKRAPAGSSIGYGGTVVLNDETTIGVVVMGYSDGIPRNASPMAGVSFDGKRAPLLGRVSMDQCVVDLGKNSTAKAGDYVTVFGENSYSIDEWASACSTINYEIVTRIASRVHRIYRH